MSTWSKITTKLSGRLARNAGWVMIGQLGRIVISSVYFVLTARALGADTYGAFIGAVAIAAILAPFSTVGAGDLLARAVSRDRSQFSEFWGNALATAAVGFVITTSMMFALALTFLDVPAATILFVAFGDLLAARLMDLACYAYRSVEQLKRVVQIQLFSYLMNLVGIGGVLITVGNPTITQWAFVYSITTVAAAVLGLTLVRREFERPSFAPSQALRQTKDGMHFSVSFAAQSIYNDIDKTMLASMSTSLDTGIYGSAYRVIDTSFAPIRSLLYASYARFFRHGASGLKGSATFAAKLLPASVGCGLVISAGLFLFAPVVPFLLGSDFEKATDAVRWLALIPLLKAIHFLAADALTGAGLQPVRTRFQIFVAVFNVLLNLWLIPAYGWRGAAWASIAADGLLALTLWAVVVLTVRKAAASATG